MPARTTPSPFTALLVIALLVLGVSPVAAEDQSLVLRADGAAVAATLTVTDPLPLDRIATQAADDTISTTVVLDAEGRPWTTWPDHAGVLPHNDPGSPFATPERFTQHMHADATGSLPPGEWTVYLAGSEETKLVVPEGAAVLTDHRSAPEMSHVSAVIDPRVAGLSGPAILTSELPAIPRGADTTSMVLGVAVVEHHQSGMHAVCLTPAERDAEACVPARGVGNQSFVISGGGTGQGWVLAAYPMYGDFYADTEVAPAYTVAAGSLTRYAYHVAFSIDHV